MALHLVAEVVLAVILGAMVLVAVLWFYASYGMWMDDAFENGRWVWFGLLLAFTVPASLIVWLVVRAFKNTPAGRGAANT